MVYPKKDMLLMKKRSDPTSSKYAECTDDGNVYTHIDTSGDPIIVEGDVEVTNFPSTQVVSGTVNVGNHPSSYPVTGSVSVSNFPSVQLVNNYNSGTNVYNSYQLISPGGKTNQYWKFEVPKPSGPIKDKYMVTIVNPTSMSMEVRMQNYATTIDGLRDANTFQSNTFTACTPSTPSATAWESCFTDIGGVLTDESADWVDTGAPLSDVPFPFTAVNDAIYFGHSAQFKSIGCNVDTLGVYNASGVWEYWNGSTWSALTVQVSYPSGSASTPFKAVTQYVSFVPVSDWVAYDIPGSPVSRFWIRFRITSFTSRTSGPGITAGNYNLYKDYVGLQYAVSNLFNGDAARIVLIAANDSTDSAIIPIYLIINEV